MAESVLVLDRRRDQRRAPLPAGAELVDSVQRVRERVSSKRELWLAPRSEDLELIFESDTFLGLKGDHRLVVHDRVDRGRSNALRAVFRVVVAAEAEVRLLPLDQLLDAMASGRREDLVVGVAMDPRDRVVVLFRGSLDPLVVPTSFFGVDPARTDADLPAFEPADFGQAIRFGDREASTDGVLYAFDADYRRRRKALLVEQDETFGGALRRLRTLRGVARSDFPGLSSKEIAQDRAGGGGTAAPQDPPDPGLTPGGPAGGDRFLLRNQGRPTDKHEGIGGSMTVEERHHVANPPSHASARW